MRVCDLHGDPLAGTGSNVYNTSWRRCLRALADEVHIAARHTRWRRKSGRRRGELDRLALTTASRSGGRHWLDTPRRAAAAWPIATGVDTRPTIVSEAELERSSAPTRRRARGLAERVAPDLAADRLGRPASSPRARGPPYAVEVDGSALEYTVTVTALQAVRAEGLARARGPGRLAAPAEDLDEIDVRRSRWHAARPPSVDVARFAARRGQGAGWRGCKRRWRETSGGGSDLRPLARRGRAAALATIEPGDRLAGLLGKLIASKGVELLLAAWPLCWPPNRGRGLMVGSERSGGPAGRPRARSRRGHLDAARALRSEEQHELPHLAAFLDGVDANAYRAGARGMTPASPGQAASIAELIDVLPAAEAMVMPSTFPEALGIVAANRACALCSRRRPLPGDGRRFGSHVGRRGPDRRSGRPDLQPVGAGARSPSSPRQPCANGSTAAPDLATATRSDRGPDARALLYVRTWRPARNGRRCAREWTAYRAQRPTSG